MKRTYQPHNKKQEENAWFSREDEDCFGKRSNQEKARKGQKKSHRLTSGWNGFNPPFLIT